MLLTAIFNTLIGMGPYYMDSTYKWIKMAMWDAPTRVFLDVQLEQIRLERNLSEEESEDEKQKWKNTSSRLSPTNIELPSFRRLNPFARTYSGSFGRKFSTAHNLLTLHPHPENVQFIPDCLRLLCPETSFPYWTKVDWSCQWLWWEEIYRSGTFHPLSKSARKSWNPLYEVQETNVLRKE